MRAPLRKPGAPRLPEPGETWAIFLDIDGTIFPIVDTPSAMHDDPEFVRLLGRLARASGGAVALITGRPIENASLLTGPLSVPMAGQHGLERRDAGGRMHRHARVVDGLRPVLAAAASLVHAHPELQIEDKGMSVAVHFRRAPQLDGVVRDALAESAAGSGLVLQPGKMVVEVKPGGWDKGRSIREFMAEPPFSGRLPVFVGDDMTDEHGFAVVNQMGGLAVKVGPGETAAGCRLDGVDDVRAWLSEVAARLNGDC